MYEMESKDQKERMSSSEEGTPPLLTSAPVNFSELTPSQFGISVQSFTPAPVSTSKDKSRLAQIKSRRRSNIGVRGSPETNSLIRFMAQERMKTRELVIRSPFPSVPSTLRQKMASFQSLMGVEESEVVNETPMQDSNTGGRIETRDSLSDPTSHDGDKENRSSLMTPTPRKRRRVGPLETCQLEIRETSAPILQFTLKEQEDKEPVKQVVTHGPLPSRETLEEATPFHTEVEPQACSPSENRQPVEFLSSMVLELSSIKSQQDSVFEPQSHSQPQSDPAAVPPSRLASYPVTSQLEMTSTEQNDSITEPTVNNTKKSVHFGPPLSPEVFDKNLPPSTPLQKGSTPARASTPGGSLEQHSVLKTPQRSESQTPQDDPGLSSPSDFGASPTLAIPRFRNFFFPSIEDIESVDTCDQECTLDPQPLNLDTAFHEESLSLILPESEAKPSTTCQMDELTSLPEEKQLEADVDVPAKPRNQSLKQGPKHESTSEAPETSEAPAASEAPACSNGGKRKLPEENGAVKRMTRSAAKFASGKIKVASRVRHRWNKEVDRSLYSTRAYASKNPNLSPIKERLSLISQSPAAQQSPATSCTNHETSLSLEMTANSQTISGPPATSTFENHSEDSIPSSHSSKESTTGKNGRLSGPRIRRGRQSRRKVSVADEAPLCEETLTRGKLEELFENQTATNSEASRETPLTHTAQQVGADPKTDAQTSADAHHPDSEGKPECSETPTSESSSALSLPPQPAQRKAKRGGRRTVNSSVLQEQGVQEEDLQTSHGVGEKEQEAQAAAEREHVRSSSDSQKDWAAPSLDLAPWQADYNFEDVFKPVPTRGQRSVRRSLRNRCDTDLGSSSAGLAWLPQTSPDHSKEARRRTRARRLSAAPPVQPSLPEEMHDTPHK